MFTDVDVTFPALWPNFRAEEKFVQSILQSQIYKNLYVYPDVYASRLNAPRTPTSCVSCAEPCDMPMAPDSITTVLPIPLPKALTNASHS